jgi:hypothetical protein
VNYVLVIFGGLTGYASDGKSRYKIKDWVHSSVSHFWWANCEHSFHGSNHGLEKSLKSIFFSLRSMACLTYAHRYTVSWNLVSVWHRPLEV